ncbi:AfsR/SARP family transcriptional regulator, partial [Streptomyces clavuligerus]
MRLGRGAGAVPLGTPKERLFLAALAYDAGRPVSRDALARRLWGDVLPDKPYESLYPHVARLRKRLAEAGECARVSRASHTYTLEIPPERVDCHLFRTLTERARALIDEGNDAEALELLRRGEELWDEPLAGLTGRWAEHIRALLTGKRLAAQITRVDVGLRLGHFTELVPELTALLDDHPMDETLVAQYMIAAYGRGRREEALHRYDTVRRLLRHEAGTDPGEHLAGVYAHILGGGPVHELTRSPEPAPAVPRTLPRHADLVG